MTVLTLSLWTNSGRHATLAFVQSSSGQRGGAYSKHSPTPLTPRMIWREGPGFK